MDGNQRLYINRKYKRRVIMIHDVFYSVYDFFSVYDYTVN